MARRSTAWLMALLASVAALSSALPAAAAPDPFGRYVFADLFDELSPAVVNIRTRQTVDGGLPTFGPDSQLWRWNDILRGTPRVESALGSGFVIDSKGVIVTNHHVIKDADEIEVAFPNGDSFDAVVVGSDEETDLAVLQVVGDVDLPAVPFANSETARVGEWVLAIGNPFGLNTSLSIGVISARGRDIGSGRYDDFIQTDAAINQGNSGGPLFNLAGEVVGVNSAIYSTTGGSVGIGFAIPAELADTVVKQLLEYGETRRGWLGVGIQEVTEGIAENYGLTRPRGALISRVDVGGPAEDAGIEPGDLILTFNGEDVTDDRALPRLVAEAQIGRAVTVEYLRQKRKMTTSVVVARLVEDRPSEAGGPEADTISSVLGLTVSPLTDRLRGRYGITDDTAGVVVVEVAPSSDAFGQIEVGDVIEQVAWKDVKGPQSFSELARAAAATEEEDGVLLTVNRRGELTYKSVKPLALP